MRSFNYTGRKKITLDRLLLQISHAGGNKFCIYGEFDLDDLLFPANAKVFVEAYYQANWMRFDFGQVSNIQAPDNTWLTEFEDIEVVLFRVKVTDAEEKKLLGLADKIRPLLPDEESDSNRSPLLPVKSTHLKGMPWHIDYSDERPILEIDKSLGNKNAVFREPLLRSLILPAAYREVLIRIVTIEKNYDPDDPDVWQTQWLRFSRILGAGKCPDIKENGMLEADDWMDDCIARLCRRHKLLDNLLEEMNCEN